MSEFANILIILTAIIANIIAIKRYAYDRENKPTCDNYVLNTYLYVLLEFLIISFIVVSTIENKAYEKFIFDMLTSWVGMIIYMIVYIMLIIKLKTINPKNNQLMLYVVWLCVVSMFAVLIHPFVKIASIFGFLKTAVIITLTLITVMSYIGIKYGNDLVTFDWDKYLTYGIIGLIIAYLIIPFTGLNNSTTYLILSIISLIIFLLLLLSFNKQLLERSKKCYEDKNPNYQVESIDLGIKIINIFGDVVKIMGNSRR